MELCEFIKVCRLPEIYRGFEPKGDIDLQGWGSGHFIFAQLIEKTRPRSIIEVGSWKGGSAVHMARQLRSQKLTCTILCVDTWLGGRGAYVDDDFFPLVPIGGTLPLFSRFLTNIVLLGFTEVIFPMPSTSVDAGAALSQLGVLTDLVYVDASHEEFDVSRDLETYWPLVRPGGVLFGDDYQIEWPGVMAAVDRFIAEHRLRHEIFDNKYVISKPEIADT